MQAKKLVVVFLISGLIAQEVRAAESSYPRRLLSQFSQSMPSFSSYNPMTINKNYMVALLVGLGLSAYAAYNIVNDNKKMLAVIAALPLLFQLRNIANFDIGAYIHRLTSSYGSLLSNVRNLFRVHNLSPALVGPSFSLNTGSNLQYGEVENVDESDLDTIDPFALKKETKNVNNRRETSDFDQAKDVKGDIEQYKKLLQEKRYEEMWSKLLKESKDKDDKAENDLYSRVWQLIHTEQEFSETMSALNRLKAADESFEKLYKKIQKASHRARL